MSYNVVYIQGTTGEITIPVDESIAVKTDGVAKVYRILGYPNVPNTKSLLGTVTASETIFGAYSSGATIVIEAEALGAFYSVGIAPKVGLRDSSYGSQGTPGTLNATGALTATLILSGIVTSTSAAAVAATVPTGATMDLASEFAIGDSYDFSVINTGPSLFTLTAASGTTLVGNAIVEGKSSGTFRLRKTAADTFVVYRLDSANSASEFQATPGTLNATGTLTAALLLTGIVTSTTGAAVVATVDTGTAMSASGTFATAESFDWSCINTGANTFTVTAGTDHTLIGAGLVAAGTSALWRSKKISATVWESYKLAGQVS